MLICPVLAMAQGHKGSVESCAPMKEGKVCYSDEVDVEGVKKGELFKAIDKWAKKNYGERCFPVECQFQQVERNDIYQLKGRVTSERYG